MSVSHFSVLWVMTRDESFNLLWYTVVLAVVWAFPSWRIVLGSGMDGGPMVFGARLQNPKGPGPLFGYQMHQSLKEPVRTVIQSRDHC